MAGNYFSRFVPHQDRVPGRCIARNDDRSGFYSNHMVKTFHITSEQPSTPKKSPSLASFFASLSLSLCPPLLLPLPAASPLRPSLASVADVPSLAGLQVQNLTHVDLVESVQSTDSQRRMDQTGARPTIKTKSAVRRLSLALSVLSPLFFRPPDKQGLRRTNFVGFSSPPALPILLLFTYSTQQSSPTHISFIHHPIQTRTN